METVALIQKLREIRKAIGYEDAAALRKLLDEAEVYAVRLQHETPEQMRRESRSNLPTLQY
jgi:hypothetical protein